MIECNDKPFVTRELDIKSNGSYSTIGYDQVNVDVTSDVPTQEKTFNNDQTTGTFFVEPDPGYLLSKVNINITPAFSLYGTGYDDTYNTWLECGIAEQIDWTINYWGGGNELSGNCDNYFRFGEEYANSNGIHDKILVFVPNYKYMRNITSARFMFAENKSLVLVPNFCDFSNCDSAEYAFSYCTALNRIKKLGLAKDNTGMFNGCENLEYIDEFFKLGQDWPIVENLNSLFYYCTKLKSVPEMNCYFVKDVTDMFYGCENLTDVGGLKDLGYSLDAGQCLSFDFCRKLTDESVNNILSKLYDMSTIVGGKNAEIEFAKNVYDRITEEQKQAALNKGWTVTTWG